MIQVLNPTDCNARVEWVPREWGISLWCFVNNEQSADLIIRLDEEQLLTWLRLAMLHRVRAEWERQHTNNTNPETTPMEEPNP